MSPRVSFTVPGDPMPKERARTVRTRGGNVRSYTPARTAAYEARIAMFARLARVPRLEGPVALTVEVYLAGRYAVAKRGSGDWDNYGKAASDALEGLAFANDAQVVRATVTKREDRANPRMVITLEAA